MARLRPEAPAPDDAAAGAAQTRAMTLFGQLAARDGAILAIGMVGVVPFGVLSVAITTRYLEPSDYGHLAILFAIASILTIVGGLGFTAGTLMATYGSGDGDEDGDDLGTEDTTAVALTARERHRLFGTGVLLVAASSGLICGTAALLAESLARALVGGPEWTNAVRWAAASAWAGSVWRLVHQTYRLERRPAAWSVVNWMRPLAVVLATLAALASGWGIVGVLQATWAGTVAASLIAVGFALPSYVIQPRAADVGLIFRKGLPFIPLQIARAIQLNLAILLLGALAPARTVGLFQVATRIAQMPTYFAEGYLAAWAPLERAPIALAAKQLKGTRQFEAQVFLLLILGTLGLLILVILLANVLVQIAPSSYREAAPLIPLMALAFCGDIAFRGIYRATSFPARRWWFMGLLLIWVFPFAGVAVLTVGHSPTYGLIAAQCVSWAVICFLMVRLDIRGGDPTPFPWRRLLLTAFVALAFVLLVNAAPGDSPARLIAALLVIAAFPATLLLIGVVPARQVMIVRSVIRSALGRGMRRSEVRRRLAAVPGPERVVLSRMARDKRTAQAVSDELGIPESLVRVRLVRALRRFAGLRNATPQDSAIGEYVLNRETTLERDLLARSLAGQGIDLVELSILDGAMAQLSRRRYASCVSPPADTEGAGRPDAGEPQAEPSADRS